MKKTIAIMSIVLLGSACAKKSSEITPMYVSPLQYSDYSCKQLAQEMGTISHRVSELAGAVDKTANNDAIQMGVGIILFWPTLFFLDGDGPQAQEYARLKGEFDALERSRIQKKCKTS